MNLECPECEFIGKTSQGLSNHIRHNHPAVWKPKEVEEFKMPTTKKEYYDLTRKIVTEALRETNAKADIDDVFPAKYQRMVNFVGRFIAGVWDNIEQSRSNNPNPNPVQAPVQEIVDIRTIPIHERARFLKRGRTPIKTSTEQTTMRNIQAAERADVIKQAKIQKEEERHIPETSNPEQQAQIEVNEGVVQALNFLKGVSPEDFEKQIGKELIPKVKPFLWMIKPSQKEFIKRLQMHELRGLIIINAPQHAEVLDKHEKGWEWLEDQANRLKELI